MVADSHDRVRPLMCGICGVAQSTPSTELSALTGGMNRALAHRGPDSDGAHSTSRAAIAVRRLAIIDLVTGDQPIPDENRRFWAVQNGEIYNFLELRRVLEGRGHRFRTNSDTEVIVHGYEEFGPDLPRHLQGMFALAVLDTRDDTIFLARDRFGEKPLFYGDAGGRLVFSSEMRSLLEWPGISRVLDREALGYYLRLGYVPEPLTMIKSIRHLPAGSSLEWSAGKTSIREYYRPDYMPDSGLADEAVAVDNVRAALRAAVERQMVSDVPIGALLSGGIDSSAVVAMLQDISPDRVRTFTVRFEDTSYDESAIARKVAGYLGTEHREIYVPDAGFEPEDLSRIIEHVGVPFADSSAIPMSIVCRHVSEHVKVCLTGDGGDEMFAGYDQFAWASHVNRLARLPDSLKAAAMAAAGASARAPLLGRSSLLRKAGRALEAARAPESLRLAVIESLFLPAELGVFIEDQETAVAATGELERFTQLPAEAADWTPLRRQMYTHLRHSLRQDMLVKIDRMSMAHSLELRAPMLDPQLAALSMSLPDRLLIRGGVRKYALREAVKSMLPPEVFSHPKTGFALPLHRFQNAAYRDIARSLLQERDGPLALLSAEALHRLLAQGLSQHRDTAGISVYRSAHRLWAMMQLAAWGKRFRVSL